MAPVVLDHGRIAVSVPLISGERGGGQLALAGLMAIAFVAILVARLSLGGDASAGEASPSPSTIAASMSPLPTASASASPASTPTPAPSATATSAPTPSPIVALRTYKVKRGDTLSGIAAEFGTTVRILVKLNGIEDPSRIGIGTVLKLPE